MLSRSADNFKKKNLAVKGRRGVLGDARVVGGFFSQRRSRPNHIFTGKMEALMREKPGTQERVKSWSVFPKEIGRG